VVAEIAWPSTAGRQRALIIHLRNLSRMSPGFDTDNVLTFVLSIPGSVARDDAEAHSLQTRVIDELHTIPAS